MQYYTQFLLGNGGIGGRIVGMEAWVGNSGCDGAGSGDCEGCNGGGGCWVVVCRAGASPKVSLILILHSSVLASTFSPSGTKSSSITPVTEESTGIAVCVIRNFTCNKPMDGYKKLKI